MLHFLLGAQFQRLSLRGLSGSKIDEDCLASNRLWKGEIILKRNIYIHKFNDTSVKCQGSMLILRHFQKMPLQALIGNTTILINDASNKH